MPVYLSPPPRSPLARLAAAVVGVLLLIGAFMVGMVAFLVFLGVASLGALWLTWQRWKLGRESGSDSTATKRPTRRDGDAIEGEYTVVSREDEGKR